MVHVSSIGLELDSLGVEPVGGLVSRILVELVRPMTLLFNLQGASHVGSLYLSLFLFISLAPSDF